MSRLEKTLDRGLQAFEKIFFPRNIARIGWVKAIEEVEETGGVRAVIELSRPTQQTLSFSGYLKDPHSFEIYGDGHGLTEGQQLQIVTQVNTLFYLTGFGISPVIRCAKLILVRPQPNEEEGPLDKNLYSDRSFRICI